MMEDRDEEEQDTYLCLWLERELGAGRLRSDLTTSFEKISL